MKKLSLALLFFISTFVLASAQNPKDSIIIKKQLLDGTLMYKNHERIKIVDAINMMSENKEALNFMKKANTNSIFSAVIGGIGGLIIGYNLGAIMNGKGNWGVGGVGLAVVAVSIPFEIGKSRNINRSVNIYNQQFRK